MPAHTYVVRVKGFRGPLAIGAHEVTKAQLPGWDRVHQRDNAFHMAEAWGYDAIVKMGLEGKAEEATYSARCAAHFANLALRFRP